MKVLVVGKGGREHAIALALHQSPKTERVYAIPGSFGMEAEAIVLADYSMAPESLLKACQDYQIDLVVVGPEGPLVAGLSDFLRAEGLAVFGPDQKGSQLEGSKIFAKEFMEKYEIPTAAYKKVSSVVEVKENLKEFTPPYVLKADGLAGGKGVFICQSEQELIAAATQIFEHNRLGSAGNKAILEQFQPGYELSFFILTNGEAYVPLPMAQDHKKLLDNNQGPNTGGMGTVAPMEISADLYEQIISQVVEPTVAGLNQEKFTYRGVVFIGLMMTEAGPQVLEYNIRFGDPETQVLLPLLVGDWGDAFAQVAQGHIPQLQWRDEAAACVVLAAENYPENPVKGVKITGDLSKKQNQYFLHAGTTRANEDWLTNGGRVLNAIGLGNNLNQAIESAYQQVNCVEWPGMQLRKDIGQQAQNLSE